MQFVHLVERGERAQMSKRAGEFVTLDDLVDEIGVDAARWFLLARSHDTTIDLDLDLARERVAREPRLLRAVRPRADRRDAGQGGLRERVPARAAPASGARRAAAAAERALIKQLLAFPAEVAEAAERRAPHRIAAYALELAQEFTAFYRDCRVRRRRARGARASGSRCASRRSARSPAALDLLGVSAPEAM